MYWFSSWDRILNVQDIIIEGTKETSISSTCRPIPSTTIAGAGKHPCCAACLFHSWTPSVTSTDKSVYASIRCTWYTQWSPTQPIPVQCWASVAAHCWVNVDQSLAQHWNRIGWLSLVYPDCHRVHWRFIPRKSTTRITRYIGPIVK